MKFLVPSVVLVLVLAAVGAAVSNPARDGAQYGLAGVTRGDVVSIVNSTGTVKPVKSVQVGSFVSGPIKELFVDFNATVKKGDVLATIDPRVYQANVARDKAILATR